jgi:hypothetical protein
VKRQFMEVTRKKALQINLILFEYFIVFIMVLYAGKASVFISSLDSWENPLGLLFPIISVAVFGFIKRVRFNHQFLLLILGYTLYFIATTVKLGSLHPRFFLINLIYFTLVYIVLSGLRYKFFTFYEDILYCLCIIALIFWTVMNIIPGTFIEFLRNFEFSTQNVPKGNVDFNTMVFTVNNYATTPDHIIHFGAISLYRNSGFAWEPGAFAVYVNIAFLFHLIRNKFKLTNQKRLLVFIAALATTFSTTGYSLFILLILFYIYNQNIVKIMWMAPVVILITGFLFTLPFMGEKISKKDGVISTEEMIYYSSRYDIQYAPQRFHSLQIDFVDFLNHPILGYGGRTELKWTTQLGAQISTVSGIGSIMARYGLVGIIFFFFSLWQSSNQIILLYKVKGIIFPFLFILLISISYSIITPLYMCIWLLYISSFLKTEVVRRRTIYNILKELDRKSLKKRIIVLI